MTHYLVGRLVQFALVLSFLFVIVFTIVRFIPGDAPAVTLGTEAMPKVLAQIPQEMGLDQPIPVQYLNRLESVLVGNFGTSWASKRPALTLILGALSVTLRIVATAFLVALLIALPAGILSAIRPGSWIDQGSTTFALLGTSLPDRRWRHRPPGSPSPSSIAGPSFPVTSPFGHLSLDHPSPHPPTASRRPFTPTRAPGFPALTRIPARRSFSLEQPKSAGPCLRSNTGWRH